MPQILLSIVGAIIRWALNLLVGLVLGYLVRWSLLSSEQMKAVLESNEFVVGSLAITTAAATLLWSLYLKYRSRLKLWLALELPQGTSVEEVRAIASTATLKETITPPEKIIIKRAKAREGDGITPVLLLLLLPAALFLGGCAINQQPPPASPGYPVVRIKVNGSPRLVTNGSQIRIGGRDAEYHYWFTTHPLPCRHEKQ